MRTLYFDCSSGISGNMVLGALTELAGDEQILRKGLQKLHTGGYSLAFSRRSKNGIMGTHVEVTLEDEEGHGCGHASLIQKENSGSSTVSMTEAQEQTDSGTAGHAHGNLHKYENLIQHHEYEYHEHGRDGHENHDHSYGDHENYDHSHGDHESHGHSHGEYEDHENHEYSHGNHENHDHSHGDYDHRHEGHDHEHDRYENHEHEHGHGHSHHHRNLADVSRIIDDSDLDEETKVLAKRIFRRVALAESRVHGRPVEEVHFHEVGAVDSIVDIVGTAILVRWLRPDRIVSGIVNDGFGFVECAHGTMSVPVPATSEIFSAGGVLWRQIDVESELVTPTGAAIIAELAEAFGPMPAMRVEKIGWGAGSRELRIPNLLKVSMGEENDSSPVEFSRTGWAEAAEVRQSETGCIGSSETGGIGPLETGGIGQSETGCIGPLETGGIGQSETGCIGSSETGCIGSSETGCIGQPETGCIGSSETGCIGQPETGGIGSSETGCIGQLETAEVRWSGASEIGSKGASEVNQEGTPGEDRTEAPGEDRTEAPGEDHTEAPGEDRSVDVRSCSDPEEEEVIVIETNIDDCSSELLGGVMERLLAEGACDVFFTPVYMKKNRPAYQLTVICHEGEFLKMQEILFCETTTIGIRYRREARRVLKRERRTISTPYGELEAKKVFFRGRSFVYPEYESVRRLSEEMGIPMKEIYRWNYGQ